MAGMELTFKSLDFEYSKLWDLPINWVGLIQSVEDLKKKHWLPPKRRGFYQPVVSGLQLQLILLSPGFCPALQILHLPASTITWANSLKELQSFSLSLSTLPLFSPILCVYVRIWNNTDRLKMNRNQLKYKSIYTLYYTANKKWL